MRVTPAVLYQEDDHRKALTWIRWVECAKRGPVPVIGQRFMTRANGRLVHHGPRRLGGLAALVQPHERRVGHLSYRHFGDR